MFLALMFLAVQVVFDLYARSAVTAAAIDAARSVADFTKSSAYNGPSGAAAERDAILAAEAHARAQLGAYGTVTRFTWSMEPSTADPTEVVLRVVFSLTGTRYALAPLPGLNHFERTIRVRIEHVVCPPTSACQIVTGPGAGGTNASGLGGT